MSDLIRDSTIGGWINYVSKGKYLPYADQRADYVVPNKYIYQSCDYSPTETLTEKGITTPKNPQDPELGVANLASVSERWRDGALELEKEEERKAASHDFKLVDWDSETDPDDPQYVLIWLNVLDYS